ncbi:M48 family metalloprotease [Reichenbachiella agarivorans]|uniref:M48 family metalloprotease n=1 Tax=Reichenbachiella agarivorans TaxID=2979464 RepID=A0ABY6CLQ0_9BACT|nr:M48 family metalloprotease [Reichenbachiella agarivorans]UXP30644.1 M48 family metalloprotease [Reichenbachiella agarivorans]
MRSLILILCVLVSSEIWGQNNSLGDKIGAATLEEVKRTMGIYEDDELLAFVQGVGEKLESAMPENKYEFKYYLVDTEEPNAFATAGGYVFVTRGLLAIIDTEDELAGVLGHEFNHVLLKHSEKKIGRNIAPMVLEIPGNLVGTLFSKTLGELMNNPIKLGAKTVNAAFDRGQENQADEHGVQLAAAAGYDPVALVSALNKLEYFVNKVNAKGGGTHLFDDHPMTDKRVEKLDEIIKSMTMDSVYDQRSILSNLEGMIVGQNPKNGVVLKGNKFLHPDMQVSYQLPSDWSVRNTPQTLTASNSKKGAAVVLAIDAESEMPLDAYKAYTKKLNKKGLGLTVDKKVEINGYQAVELLIDQYNGKGERSIVVWLKMEGVPGVLQFVGSGRDEEVLEEIKSSIYSFQAITEEERSMILSMTFNSEVAQEETVTELAERMGLSDQIKWLEVMNVTDADQKVTSPNVKYLDIEVYTP